MRIFTLRRRFRALCSVQQSRLASIPTHASHTIERRLAIIEFFSKHGPKTTKEAFGVSRSTVYNWKKTLSANKGRTTSLAPRSTAPVRVRTRQTPPRLKEFILNYRAAHPRVGQEAIKPCLDAYCRDIKADTISTATIGRVISDLKKAGRLHDDHIKLRYDARLGNISCHVRKKARKLRRKGYMPRGPGDVVQVDSMAIFMDGLKRYIVTAIDLKTRFAFACAYGSLSSLSARDFMEKFRKAAPFEIRHVQTDNGQEFARHFREYAQQNNIVQFFNYPRSPKSNAHVERFNRTVREQHVDWHMEDLREPRIFNAGLMEYLVWYNTEKPHQGLGYRTPMRCVMDELGLTPEKSNMLRYSTWP